MTTSGQARDAGSDALAIIEAVKEGRHGDVAYLVRIWDDDCPMVVIALAEMFVISHGDDVDAVVDHFRGPLQDGRSDSEQ